MAHSKKEDWGLSVILQTGIAERVIRECEISIYHLQ